MSEEETLPNNCCAKCGFLYGLYQIASVYSENISFDPDLLRDKVPEVINADGTFNIDKRIATTPFPTANGIGHYSLAGLASLNCYHKIFPIFKINFGDNSMTVAAEATRIKDLLKLDRLLTNPPCHYFYPYRHGFSAKEHAEIQMQEERDAQQQAYQDKWNTLIFEAEENARKREESWKQLEERHRIYNIWITTANFILAVILGGIVVAELLSTFISPK